MITSRIVLEVLIFGSIIWWTVSKLKQSERQKQEYYQQLLTSEQKFKAIFDRTFQFTGLLTPDGTLLEANQTALDFGGITLSDVVDKPFWTAYWWQISPQTQADLKSAIAKARTGEFIRYPVKVRGKGDRVITIDFSLRPVKDKTGEVVLLIPEGRDISEQVKAEQALEQSRAKYQAIIEEQVELICRYRQDATVSYVNDAFCSYFGIEKEEIIDCEYNPVVYEADRAKVARLVGTMTREDPTVTIENRVIAKGAIRWTQWNNRLIFDEVGNFVEYQAVGRDITPLKEIELRLRESEEKFRRAFEDAATGEALVAPDGTFIRVNRSLCEIVGYEEAELVNKTVREITHPEDLNLDLSYIRQMLTGEIRTYQMEKRYFHRLGYVVWVLLSVSMVRDIDGEPMYFIAQMQDVSQRKRAETRLKALVEELERSNQELEEFATFVSHDLISPLQKQLLVLDLVKEEYAASLGKKGLNYFDRIIGYNWRMNSLVRSILTYARITTKAQSFVLVDLNDLIKDVLDEIKPEIDRVKAKVEVGQLPIIKGDRLQLNQLFLNLLQNALKFYSRDRIPEIKIQYCRDKDWHQITISDNGIGFETEQHLKIFAPFHRLHSQSKYKGTGLGLAICEKIVERHQGTITAFSQIERGATFTICLP